MNRDEVIKIVWMPILIVILTALFGGLLGTWLQNRSFKKNALFQAKLNMLTSARQQALEIRQGVDEARRKIRANERFAKNLLSSLKTKGKAEDLSYAESVYCVPAYQGQYVDILKEAGIRVESLREDAAGRSPSSINSAIDEFLKNLKPYVACLDKSGCRECGEDNENVVESLDKVVAAHTSASERLLAESQ
jgi:hypothetical protein